MSITVPTNIPSGDRRTILVSLPSVPAPLVLVDRDGDVWRQVGVTKTGEPHMVCDSPSDPAEVGSGESDPWTPKAIRAWFSPVRTLGGAA
ncbi:hypothetical protein [Streptosporangium amethystogenes]|uniref:hypothetical protein n=1 Tax=Streptosporangium amethystogenes TaxID=2002 RepID=UPI0004C707B4|nr:hypothetical protein [Streptosporangium amethystogenes]